MLRSDSGTSLASSLRGSDTEATDESLNSEPKRRAFDNSLRSAARWLGVHCIVPFLGVLLAFAIDSLVAPIQVTVIAGDAALSKPLKANTVPAAWTCVIALAIPPLVVASVLRGKAKHGFPLYRFVRLMASLVRCFTMTLV